MSSEELRAASNVFLSAPAAPRRKRRRLGRSRLAPPVLIRAQRGAPKDVRNVYLGLQMYHENNTSIPSYMFLLYEPQDSLMLGVVSGNIRGLKTPMV